MLIISNCRLGVNHFFSIKGKEETQATCYDFANKITKALLLLRKHLGSFKKALVLLVLTCDNPNKKAWNPVLGTHLSNSSQPRLRRLNVSWAHLHLWQLYSLWAHFLIWNIFGFLLAVPESGGLRLLAERGMRSQTPLESQPDSSQPINFEGGPQTLWDPVSSSVKQE